MPGESEAVSAGAHTTRNNQMILQLKFSQLGLFGSPICLHKLVVSSRIVRFQADRMLQFPHRAGIVSGVSVNNT